MVKSHGGLITGAPVDESTGMDEQATLEVHGMHWWTIIVPPSEMLATCEQSVGVPFGKSKMTCTG